MKKLMRINEVCASLHIAKGTLYDMVKHGRFPKPLRLSARNVAWYEDDIDAWLKEKEMQRDTVEWEYHRPVKAIESKPVPITDLRGKEVEVFEQSEKTEVWTDDGHSGDTVD